MQRKACPDQRGVFKYLREVADKKIVTGCDVVLFYFEVKVLSGECRFPGFFVVVGPTVARGGVMAFQARRYRGPICPDDECGQKISPVTSCGS